MDTVRHEEMVRRSARGRGHRTPALLAIACAGLSSPAWSAPKTDVVELVNGDHITCEIKALEHNRLKVSTDHMGTVYIEWDKIARLQSTQYLLLERTDGVRYYGQLARGEGEGKLYVDKGDGRPVEPLDVAVVVRAAPIEGGDFVDRLDGYLSAGLDFTKANDRKSLDFSGGLSSRSRIREWSVDAWSNITDDAEQHDERYDVQGNLRRLLPRRNYYQGFAGFARNTELELDFRSLLGAGVGRYFVQTNLTEWQAGAGFAYTHEEYRGGESVDSLEAVLRTDFSVFRYDFPETDIGGSLSLIPSLTESGRYRAEGDVRARYEFVDDLYFELKLYGSYDSEPPSEDTEQSDYGFVTSLGYSF